MALTSKYIYSIAEKILYRKLRIKLEYSELPYYEELLKRLICTPKVYTNVQDIEVLSLDSFRYDGLPYQKVAALLSTFVSKTHRLQIFTCVSRQYLLMTRFSHILVYNRWRPCLPMPSIPMTKNMLETIVTSCPDCHLCVEIFATPGMYVTLSEMRSNTCLTSLAVTVGGAMFQAFTELQLTVYSCPSLRTLSVTIGPTGQAPEESPMKWMDYSDQPLTLHTLKLDGFCPKATNGSALAMVTKVSALRHLSIINVFHVPNLDCENLRSLRVVPVETDFDVPQEMTWMTQFLHSCKFLRVLDVTGFTKCFDPPLLEHLGKTLKCLRLHQYESRSGLQRRPILSSDAISTLGITCPHLDFLGLDIAYQQQWVCLKSSPPSQVPPLTLVHKPYPVLDCLAKYMCFLVELELNLEINIADPDNTLQPPATLASVSHLWDYVWSRMQHATKERSLVCQRPRLRQLNVNAGSFRPPSPYDWEQSQQQRFQANISKNHDGARKGLAKTVCLEIEEMRCHDYGANALNIESALLRATRGPSNDPEPDYYNLSLRRAIWLPFPED